MGIIKNPQKERRSKKKKKLKREGITFFFVGKT
jgi:hypothetical protein